MNTTRMAAVALALSTASPAAAETLTVGKPAPELELTTIDGEKIRLADLKGQVVVLNFWATWCVPCRKELPLLDAYYRRVRDRGLRVFAITTEDSAPMFRMKPLFALMAIPSIRKVKGMSTAMKAVPTNFVIDRAGIVRHARPGAFELDDLNATLIPLLNERPAS